VRAYRTGALAELKSWMARNRGLAAMSGATGLALLIGFLIASGQAFRATQAEREQAKLRTHAEQTAELLRVNAYASDVRAAQIALDEGNLRRCRELLSRHRPKPGQTDIRGFEWRYLWGASRSDSVAVFKHDAFIVRAVLLPDLKRLVTQTLPGTVTVWDIPGNRIIGSLAQAAPSDIRDRKIDLSPDGSRFAVCGTNAVVVYETRSWTPVGQLPVQAWQVAFTPDSAELVLTHTNELRFWNLERDRAAVVPRQLSRASYQQTVITPDGQRMLLNHRFSETIEVWDLPTRSLKRIVPNVGSCVSMAISPDGRWLATGCWEGCVALWTLPEMSLVTTNQAHPGLTLAVAFSPDSRILVSGGNDQLIKLWRVPDPGTAPELMLVETLRGHGSEVWSLAFSADGTHILSGSADGTARLWPVNNQGRRPVSIDLKLSSKSLHSLLGSFASSRHGTVWAGRTNGTLIGWNIRTGTELPPLSMPPDFNGRWLQFWNECVVYSAQNDGIALWDPHSAKHELLLAHGGRLAPMGIITNRGRVFILVRRDDPPRTQVWMAGATEACREPWTRTFETLGYTAWVQSPDGKLLVNGALDYSLNLSTFDDPPATRRLVGHLWRIYCHSFSPDSRWIASGSWEPTVRLWDAAEDWKCVKTLRGHRSGVYFTQFTPDGRTLISVGADNAIRFWNVQTGQEMMFLNGYGIPSWLVPPDTADGLLIVKLPFPCQLQFTAVASLEAIDAEIQRQMATSQ